MTQRLCRGLPGETPAKVHDIIKDPVILKFLGLNLEAVYYERALGTALIIHLKQFLLELGKSFYW